MPGERKAPPPRSEWAKNCTDHCGGCGRHFHGTSAFDAHRITLEDGERGCADPAVHIREHQGVRRKTHQVYTTDGHCKIDKPPKDFYPVTIWQTRQNGGDGAQVAQ